MKKYNILPTAHTVQFSYKNLPALFFVTLHSLGVAVEFTGSKILPYIVKITESEFMSCVELTDGA